MIDTAQSSFRGETDSREASKYHSSFLFNSFDILEFGHG
jgi:hypothetical protein